MIGVGIGLYGRQRRGAAPALAAPANVSAPAIAGGPGVGSVLTLASVGSWTGYPLPYALQWRVDGAAVSGATGSGFDTTGLAPGAVVTLRVQVTNAGGSASAVSNAITLEAAGSGAGDAGGTGNLAYGLNAINDYSPAQPFINVMKCAREWENSPPLNAQGYPTALPNGAAGAYILTDMAAGAASLAGTYHVTWEGTGTLTVLFVSDLTTVGARHMTFDYSPGPGILAMVQITATSAGDPIRNIAVVHEGNLARHAAGEIFSPVWLEAIRGSKAIRFMDWQSTNELEWSIPIQAYADLCPVDYYSYGTRRTVPVQIMCAIANEIEADPWICIPHRAVDGFGTSLAAEILAHLDADRTAYFEWSNEVWNFQFGQTHYCLDQADARWPGAGGDAWQQWAGMRAAAMMTEVTAAFATAGRSDRLKRVAALHTGWLGLQDAFLLAPLYVAEGGGHVAPWHSFDCYAITGYFSGEMVTEPHLAAVQGWIAASAAAAASSASSLGLSGGAATAYVAAHRLDQAIANVVQEVADNSLLAGANSLQGMIDTIWPYHKAAATSYGLQLVMYEGGTHVIGFGSVQNEDAVTELLVAANYSQAMADLYQQAFEAWADVSDFPFMQFVEVSAPSKYGSWGARRWLGDENPRQAVTDAWRDTGTGGSGTGGGGTGGSWSLSGGVAQVTIAAAPAVTAPVATGAALSITISE